MSTHLTRCRLLGGVLLAVHVLALTACGGGNDSGRHGTFSVGITVDQLNGTWTGSLEDSGGILRTFSVTIAGGSITQVLIDGADQSQTGTITQESNTLFSVVLNSHDTRLFVDTRAAYAVFLDDATNFGVIEKDALPPLPTFLADDVNGNWAGRTLTTDFTTFNLFASSGTCASQTCSNTGNGVTASVDLTATFNATYGNWTGNYTVAATSETGTVSLLMSDDQNFVGFYQCKTGGTYPVDCTFSAWVRQ